MSIKKLERDYEELAKTTDISIFPIIVPEKRVLHKKYHKISFRCDVPVLFAKNSLKMVISDCDFQALFTKKGSFRTSAIKLVPGMIFHFCLAKTWLNGNVSIFHALVTRKRILHKISVLDVIFQ